MKSALSLFGFLALFSGKAVALDPQALEVISAAEKMLNDVNDRLIAEKSPVAGEDLNGDGKRDFVQLLEYIKPSDDEEDHRIFMAVYLSAPGSTGVHFFNASGDTLWHERVSQDVEMEKNSIFLTRSGHGGVSGFYERFQFRMMKGQLLLIGKETIFSKAGDEGWDHSGGESVNYLTCKKKVWEKSPNGKVWRNEKFDPPCGRWKFEDFSY